MRRQLHWTICFLLGLLSVFALIASACGDEETDATSTADDSGEAADDGGADSAGGTPDLADWTYPVAYLSAEGAVVEDVEWSPLSPDEITQDWNICAAIVHLKDSYWTALDYGLADEATRQGVNMTLLAAGGYTELATQLNQLDDCVAQGADGIIVGATSPDGVVAKVEEIVANGTPVVGIGVPVFSDQVPVAFASFVLQGQKVGEFLLAEVGDGTESVQVAWFPGPAGAGWPDDSLNGFNQVIEGSNIEVIDVKYGDTGKEAQLALIEDTLQAYEDIDYIIANAVAADVAPQVLTEAGRDIPVISTYITPETFDGMVDASLLATVSDSTALTGRLGMDMLLRILEDQEFLGSHPTKDIGPNPVLVTSDNLAEFEADRIYHITPDGFEPVFNVGG